MWCTGTDHACGAVDCVEMFCSVVDVNAGSHHVPILHLEEQLGDQSLKESGFENAALGRSCRPPNGSAPCSTLTCDKLGVVGRERTANMIPSGGYRNFSDYASANNPRDSYLMNVQELLNQERGLSGGTSRFLDSDSDSDYEYSDARSQLGEQQILEARYGRNQIFYIQPDPVTPGDYLHQAFEVAAECKSQLNKQSIDMAVAALVKACSLSTFSLSVIHPESEECGKFLTDVENSFRSQHTPSGSVFWAAKCIMIGFGLITTPKRFELTFNSMALHQAFYQLPMQLSPEDVFWVAHLGRFKAHFNALKDSEPASRGQEDLLGMSLTRYPEVGSSLLKATKHDVDVMNKFRPEHPLTLQSARMLAQFLQKPEVPLRMMDGARSAMNQYSDPAQAMQHLLHGMYSELMVCYGRPKPDVQKGLLEAADAVVVTIKALKHVRFNNMMDITLWDLTADKLQLCMFALARAFPLQEALAGHQLVAFIERTHQEWRQLPSGPNSKVWQLFSVDRPTSPVNSSFSTDAKLTDDDSAPIHQCGRCTRVRKETEMFVCDKCRITWYCSNDCLTRDAQVHRHSCSRNQLKKKMQSQKSRRAQASP